MGIFDVIGKGISSALDFASVALAHPIKTAEAIISPTKTVKDLEDDFFSQSTASRVTQVVTGTLGIAGSIVGGSAINAAAKSGTLISGAGTVLKSVGSAAVAHPVLALATPVVAGAVISSSSARHAVVNAPSALADFGSSIGQAIDNPSLSSITNVVKEHPVLSTITAGAAALAAGGLVSTAVTALNTRSVNKNTNAMTNSETSDPVVIPTQSQSPVIVTSPVQTPIDEQPKTTAKKKVTKKKKKAKKKVTKKKKKTVKKKSKKKTIKRRKSKK